jgi:hypothetical protein
MSRLRKERSKQSVVEGMSGKNHSSETKEKLRRAAVEQFSREENREIQRQKALEQYKDPNQRYKAGNGNRGKKWYHSPDTFHNIKCFEKDKPQGYIKGRIIKKERRW